MSTDFVRNWCSKCTVSHRAATNKSKNWGIRYIHVNLLLVFLCVPSHSFANHCGVVLCDCFIYLACCCLSKVTLFYEKCSVGGSSGIWVILLASFFLDNVNVLFCSAYTDAYHLLINFLKVLDWFFIHDSCLFTRNFRN